MFKLGRFAENGGKSFTGVVVADTVYGLVDLVKVAGPSVLTGAESIDDLLADWGAAFEALASLAERIARDRLTGGRLLPRHRGEALAVLAPIAHPSKILCAAANYGGHVKEMRASNYGGPIDQKKDFMGDKAKTRPYLFLKAPSAITGPYDDIVLPASGENIDWELELGVVMGARARYLSAKDAYAHIAGYVVSNDISCRGLLWREDRQSIRSDWLASKSHDTFCPLGPYFVPRNFVANHNDLMLHLKVNGEVMQNGNTGEMIFSPDEQIEYASQVMTLEPGDLFMTGTVSGVGQGRGKFLHAGDVVEAEISGLGIQRNRVTAAND